jgi:TrkA domain protein
MTPRDVTVTPLPGVGDRCEFTTAGGEHVGVVRHRDADRELIVFSRDDPDACRLSLRLSGSDARMLATLLGEGDVTDAG